MNIRKGFSLIELLVVIVLISIISVIVFVNFGNQTPKARNAMRLDSSSKILTAFQLANLEEKISSNDCLNGSMAYVLSGTISGTGCHITLDGQQESKNFLKELKITGNFQDPLNETKGNDDFIYGFNYKLGSSQQEFVYLTEPTETTSFLNTYALSYQSGSVNELHIDGNYPSLDKLISPILIKNSDGTMNSEFENSVVKELVNGKSIIKSFSNSTELSNKMKNLITISKTKGKIDSNESSKGDDLIVNGKNFIAKFEGTMAVEKYKGRTYPNSPTGIIDLGIPAGNTVESVNVTTLNGMIPPIYEVDGNKLKKIIYTAPSIESQVLTDKIIIEGFYYPTNQQGAEKKEFISEINFDVKGPTEFSSNIESANPIVHLNKTYNGNVITISIPPNTDMGNIEISSKKGQILSRTILNNKVSFNYKTPSSEPNDQIIVKGVYFPKENPYGENTIPFISTSNIEGLTEEITNAGVGGNITCPYGGALPDCGFYELGEGMDNQVFHVSNENSNSVNFFAQALLAQESTFVYLCNYVSCSEFQVQSGDIISFKQDEVYVNGIKLNIESSVFKLWGGVSHPSLQISIAGKTQDLIVVPYQ